MYGGSTYGRPMSNSMYGGSSFGGGYGSSYGGGYGSGAMTPFGSRYNGMGGGYGSGMGMGGMGPMGGPAGKPLVLSLQHRHCLFTYCICAWFFFGMLCHLLAWLPRYVLSKHHVILGKASCCWTSRCAS